MTTTMERPAIKCKYRRADGQQCPLEAEPQQDYCRFHQPV